MYFVDTIQHFLRPYRSDLLLDGLLILLLEGALVDRSGVTLVGIVPLWFLHAHISPVGRKIGQLVAAVHRQSHPIDMINQSVNNSTVIKTFMVIKIGKTS
jgi:hypothetical protein